jgi:hypothetical protein
MRDHRQPHGAWLTCGIGKGGSLRCRRHRSASFVPCLRDVDDEIGDQRPADNRPHQFQATGFRKDQQRFPSPWRADKLPGGYVVLDANGQALAYVYSRDNEAETRHAKVLTKDEGRRVAINIARLRAVGEGRPRGEAMNANLLPRLNEEYPASRHSTAWALDESGVPTRRAGWNVGDEDTPASDKR